jgi:transposase
MSNKSTATVATMGIDIGKNSFHVIGLDERGAIVLRQKWSRGQVEARLANMPPCLIGMEACVGAHHLSRKLQSYGHDARLMPAKYVRPYAKGQKNDFRDGETIAEAVQRPTMKLVATKTADQLDLQALHRVRERLVSQRTGIINQIRAFMLERGVAVRALRAQALDRSRQEAAAPQRAGDRACQQARAHRLGCSQQGAQLRMREDACGFVPTCLSVAPCVGPDIADRPGTRRCCTIFPHGGRTSCR